METIKIDVPKKQLLLLLGLSALMTIVSAWVAYIGWEGTYELALLGSWTSPLALISGVIGFVFFGFSVYFWLMRYFSPKPALEITDQGVIDNSTAIATKTMIPFSNIEKASVQSFQGNDYLAIDVKDEEAVLNSVSALKRTTMKTNKNQFGTSLVIITLKGQSVADLERYAQVINERAGRGA
ncbi:hypothetical protein GCM10008932_08900 [Alkalibacterium iburiense]|uniref:Uncharacterized protein n=1 Tax=Alkalibacterium iburiense TaxID=290589 RepID=A0ABP3GZ33_9LACT